MQDLSTTLGGILLTVSAVISNFCRIVVLTRGVNENLGFDSQFNKQTFSRASVHRSVQHRSGDTVVKKEWNRWMPNAHSVMNERCINTGSIKVCK
jgi:hypothetical protein